jgi:DNA-binding NarL/FixJ family response regulator
VVITDVVMPDGDGVELISRLKKAGSPVGILVMSGGSVKAASPTCLQLAQNVGADALLLKPFKPDQLRRAVHHVIEAATRRFEDQLRSKKARRDRSEELEVGSPISTSF